MNQNLPEPDDQRLRNLLRQVELPEGLARRLKAIPELDPLSRDDRPALAQPKAPSRPSRRSLARPVAAALGLAAAVLLMVLVWQLWPPRLPQHSLVQDGPQADPAGEASSLLAEKAGLDREAEALRLAIAELELDGLRRKRDQLLASASGSPARWLPPRESTALTLALGCQAAHELGVPASELAADLDRLESGFEGTSGAKLALQLRAELEPQ